MPILFSLVARDKKISAKYASCDGNFSEIADEVLSKVPSKNEKMTYAHGHYLLHYISENQYFYFCITDKTCQRSRAFLYLAEMKRRFTPSQGASFVAVLADEMYRYNEDYSTIVISKGDLDELNSIGVGDSEALLGEKILFVNNPEELRYTLTLNHVGATPQTPLLEEKARETHATNSGTVEKAIQTNETWNTYSTSTESKESPESSEKSNFLYYIVVTVILILMWLALSSLGPVSLVTVAVICVFSVTKLSKSKKE
ncbi:regulated-SNARE-like domain-containing protein [Phthorimaea operculella]|nr:regulated-SNARE-like domain-containing protein [Phthorimaea operculella]